MTRTTVTFFEPEPTYLAGVMNGKIMINKAFKTVNA